MQRGSKRRRRRAREIASARCHLRPAAVFGKCYDASRHRTAVDSALRRRLAAHRSASRDALTLAPSTRMRGWTHRRAVATRRKEEGPFRELEVVPRTCWGCPTTPRSVSTTRPAAHGYAPYGATFRHDGHEVEGDQDLRVDIYTPLERESARAVRVRKQRSRSARKSLHTAQAARVMETAQGVQPRSTS